MRKLGLALLLLVVLLIVLSPSLLTTASDGVRTHQLVRLSQLDSKQYRSAAMTEVMNYYGYSYRLTDVLAVKSSIGAITPRLGLVQEDGIARTVAHFGFQTTSDHQFTLDQIIGLANQRTPVSWAFPLSDTLVVICWS